MDRRLLKEPVILKTQIRLDNEQLDNQHDPLLYTKPTIPASISTDDLTIFSELTPPPNILSIISLDMNTSKGSASELATDYF